MDFIKEIYGMILGLIRNIMVVFGGDTTEIDKLIDEYEESLKEDTEATV